MKRIIVIDLDDTLAEFVEPFLLFLAEKNRAIRREDIRGSLIEMGVSKEDFDEFSRMGFLSILHPFPESQRYIQLLLQYYHIVVATSRSPDLDTLTWMKKCFPGIFTVFTREKGDFCRSIGAYALIEDQSQYTKQFDNSFIIAAPWNEGTKCRLRGTWKEIAEFLVAEGKLWKYRVGGPLDY